MSDLSTNGSFAIVKKIMSNDEPKIVPFIRSGNCGETFINLSDLEYISELSHKQLPKSTTKLHDIMMARKGKIGGASIITENEVNYNCNENVIKLTIIDKARYNPFYFTVYFNSKFGLKQIERLSTGNVQPWLSIFQIRKLLIPELNKQFQLQIENLVQSSYKKVEESKTLYKEAEELLLKEIDLLDFKPSVENISIKSFKDSFGTSGRIDSEYYQPKYDELVAHIEKTKFDKLSNIVNIKKSIEPGSEAYQEEGIPFIRVSNVTKFGISDTDIYLSKNILKEEELQKLYPTKDTILLSKDGTVGIAYKIKNEKEMITSGALLHLSIKKDDILPEYLTLVLNSLIVQFQAQRDAGGSIIQHWKPSEIQEILIPIIDISIQTKIEEKIKKSFELKEESKQLLDLAKKVVEIAIEKDEEEAIKFISNRN
ncbi:restriction endonuclease subunit S domain-containing protein [Aliarcobacter butzleri]|uniref:restriction endonuclease subunit S n=1 Tax=Aliarcobacter butzleri TaxID=28197 RepID=UPI0002D51DD6|nr:restriction endonuclease subunit S [Aliarcobacter butzleri]SNV23624.1 EcoKI restriction-modification system protein HsdS [Aliarcobacter butzleri]